MKVQVLVPTHLARLSALEVARVNKTASSLNPGQTLGFVVPRSTDAAFYSDLWPSAEIHTFDDKHFASGRAYNKLMLRNCFYQRFSHYESVVVCQTDAFLLRPLSVAQLKFDYVGAPWRPPIRAGWNPVTRRVTAGRLALHRRSLVVGNGGLSIRNIEAFLAFTKALPKINFTPHEDLTVAYFGPSFRMRLPSADEAAGIFMESHARPWKFGDPIPSVNGFHALERFNPLLETEILSGAR